MVIPRLLSGAHPRWRGEHAEVSQVSSAATGSSPLARGALAELGYLQYGEGLIPAGAGSTHPSVLLTIKELAHPRWRGEHPKIQELTDRANGSSPLARGAHRSLPSWK